ncbi:MAG: MBL fold metallo-hydrolase [Anaerolineaceae bacterium]|jgi:glyoxylase-like metal-dependent hydrolase (beta-lactamase superfamily II)|nr:MBL fold metallo-hydrolase [Chloroflexota bacterium]
MRLTYETLTIGPMGNNIYFLVDEDTKDCVVIDPGFLPKTQLDFINEKGWKLRQIWVTHGHFDHIAGVKSLSEAFDPPVPIAMHPVSFEWAKENPPDEIYGVRVDEVPRVDIPLAHGIWLGIDPQSDEKVVEVRDVSGHNPGSVIFYCPDLKIAFVGDAIFKDSIGRTDFAGSDHQLLLKNIREQIYTLPEETVLLPGHMDTTTVGHEKRFNPFVRG